MSPQVQWWLNWVYGILGGCIMALWGFVANYVRGKFSKVKNMENTLSVQGELLTAMAQNTICYLCETHIADGYITTDALSVLTHMYDAYVKNGGNGVAKKVYEDVINLPIK